VRHLHGWEAYVAEVGFGAWVLFCLAAAFWDDIRDVFR
jgi:hypothetical protein